MSDACTPGASASLEMPRSCRAKVSASTVTPGFATRAVNWAAQTVGIYAVLLGPNGESQTHTPPIEFTLSPYSFPFSDNTLLPSGNRFGIYLTRIDDIPVDPLTFEARGFGTC